MHKEIVLSTLEDKPYDDVDEPASGARATNKKITSSFKIVAL